VGLRLASGQPGVEGDIVWEITSEGGSALREYRAGKTPEGFVETVMLGTLRWDGEYVAVVSLTSGGLELVSGFAPNLLQPSMWKASAGRTLTEDEFESLRACG